MGRSSWDCNLTKPKMSQCAVDTSRMCNGNGLYPKPLHVKKNSITAQKRFKEKDWKPLQERDTRTKLERMSANPILISQSNVTLLTKKPLLLHESDYEPSWCFYYSSWKESDCRGGEGTETKLGGGRKKAGKKGKNTMFSLSIFLFVTKPTKTDFALKENAHSQRFGFTLKDVLPICCKLWLQLY